MKVIKATIKADGQVVLDKPLQLPYSCRAVITIIDTNKVAETA